MYSKNISGLAVSVYECRKNARHELSDLNKIAILGQNAPKIVSLGRVDLCLSETICDDKPRFYKHLDRLNLSRQVRRFCERLSPWIRKVGKGGTK